jgi:hypothetical protein
MYILPVFNELLEPNRRFTLTVDSDVRDFDVRDGPKQLRTLSHCCDIALPAGVELATRVCLIPKLKNVWSYTSTLLHAFIS